MAIQHIAPPAFYTASVAAVRQAKEDGYVHFYEFVDMYELDDVGRRKVRKLTQVFPMPDVYASVAKQLGLDLVAQQFDALVGLVNDLDVNADISPHEFLRRVEEALGTIELSREDIDTPLSEPVSGGIPPESWMPVVLGSRNVDLADRVLAAEHDRIVITYGAAREPGWLEDIQKLDESWGPAAV